MRVILAHHANCFTAEQNPDRPLTDLGMAQADRIGNHLKAAGIKPRCIVHSGRLWTRQTAERVATAFGNPGLAQESAYPVFADSPLQPFLDDIASGGGDVVMTGHSEFLRRAGAVMTGGDEGRVVIEYKPGHGALFCLEGEGYDWVVSYGLRQEHMEAFGG